VATLYLIVAVISYFLGSIPFGYLLVKFFRGEDIRLTGSGNIGATNVVRSGAKGLGIATLILDALKGVLAVWIAFSVTKPQVYQDSTSGIASLPLLSVAALFAILGHMFPVWLKFKGGKGVATALGAFAVLFPKAILVSLIIFIVAVALSRYVSLGSMLAAIAFPIASYFLYTADWPSLLPICIASLLIVMKHRQNISRLLTGNENRLGGKKPQSAEKRA
jgi:glycerol-3-phosphate acyltransferase PlsY